MGEISWNVFLLISHAVDVVHTIQVVATRSRVGVVVGAPGLPHRGLGAEQCTWNAEVPGSATFTSVVASYAQECGMLLKQQQTNM